MRVCDKCGAEAYAHLHIDRDDIHLDVCSAHYAAFFEWLSAADERHDMQVQNSPPAEQAGSNGTPGTRRKRGRPPINRQVEP